jgi:hypothetical protein
MTITRRNDARARRALGSVRDVSIFNVAGCDTARRRVGEDAGERMLARYAERSWRRR